MIKTERTGICPAAYSFTEERIQAFLKEVIPFELDGGENLKKRMPMVKRTITITAEVEDEHL